VPTRDAGQMATLESYLARLNVALGKVPAADRQDILLETRSHVVELTRRSPSRTVDDVLAELGSPEVYARRFLSNDEPLPPPRPTALRGLARLATGRLRTLPLFAVVVGAYAIAAFTFLFAIAKLMEPNATGLFVNNVDGHRQVLLVWSDPRAKGRDVLGYGIVPIALLISVSIHLVMSALLRRVLRNDDRYHARRS
jgi:hypothetical protein